MKSLHLRAMIVSLLIIAIIAGLGLFTLRLGRDGRDWAEFTTNGNVYRSGRLRRGILTDRDGTELARITDGGIVYPEDPDLRRALVHITGDRSGSVAGGAFRLYRDEFVDYDIVNGVRDYVSGQGKTLALAVSAELNKAALEALEGRRGTVSIADAETGEILCRVSSPTFDPLGEEVPDGAYVDRFLAGSYVPGSVFKLVTLWAALENIPDIEDREFDCAGEITVHGAKITCMAPHGQMKIDDALARSCNCVFASLALELGPGIMAEYAEKAGITQGFHIDGAAVSRGRFDDYEPGSPALAWSGAGQSTVLVTPAAMLRFVTAIAADGTAPELTERLGGTGNRQELMSTRTARRIRDIMAYTARGYALDLPEGAAPFAKSGTAEVGGDARPHAWMVGFFTWEGRTYSFAVVVENGGFGSGTAGGVLEKTAAAMKKQKSGQEQ